MTVPDIGGTWSNRDGQSVASMYTEDGVRHVVADGERAEGHEEIAANAQALIDAVPDEVVEIRKVTEGTNDTVAVEWVFKGTHQNDMPGWPANGEAVELLGVSVCDMEGDLIKEERVYWDAATLLAGAGVL